MRSLAEARCASLWTGGRLGLSLSAALSVDVMQPPGMSLEVGESIGQDTQRRCLALLL